MVYCTKCGTFNPDNATTCSNCGAPLSGAEIRPYNRYERQRYYESEYGHRYRGNGFGLLIAGLFIVILGLAAIFGSIKLFFQYFWPVVLILIGVWLLLWGLRRNSRYRQVPPHRLCVYL